MQPVFHSNHPPVIIAKVGAPHGIRGDLRLHVFMEEPEDFFNFDMSQLMIEEKSSCFIPLKNCQIFDKGGVFYIRFDDFKDRDLARRFVNKSIAVAREALPKLENQDEVYFADLEGLEVINQDNKILGIVDHVLETGANEVLVIKKLKSKSKSMVQENGEQKFQECLVPYVSAHVLNIDLDNKKIWVNWDEDF